MTTPEMQLLAVRHTPKLPEDMLLQQDKVMELREWLHNTPRGTLIVSAPVGAGVTTLITQITSTMNVETMWFTSSAPCQKQMLLEAASSPITATLKRRILVFDDILAGGNMDGQAEMLALLKRKPPVPIIIVGKSTRVGKFGELMKTYPCISFPPPSADSIYALLRDIAAKDRIEINDDDIRRISDSVHGDVRSALAALETRLVSATKDVEPFVEGLVSADAIVTGKRKFGVRESLAMFSADSNIIAAAIFENYCSGAGRDLETVVAVSEAQSLADVVDTAIFSHQRFDLLEFYGAMSVSYPAYLLPHSKAQPKKCEKYGTMWSKIYLAHSKQKNVTCITLQRRIAGMQRLSVEEIAYLRQAVTLAVESQDIDTLRQLTKGFDAAGILALMRLWSFSGYKQNQHTKVRQWLGLVKKEGG